MTRKRPDTEAGVDNVGTIGFSQDDLGDIASSVEAIQDPDDLPELISALDNSMMQSIMASVAASIDGADEVLSEGTGQRPTAWELAKWANGPYCPRLAKTEMCERISQVLETQTPSAVTLVGGLLFTPERVISISELRGIFQKAVDDGRKVAWPLAPLVTAWQNPPREVQPSARTRGRVMPSRLGMAHQADNRLDRLLFSPAAHTVPGSDGEQYIMPGFGRNDTYEPSPALPLALYDLGAGPATTRGKGAPLALRIFMESVLSVPMQVREKGEPVGLSVSLRDFLAWLYPRRIPSPAEYWPRLMTAIEALDSVDARIPIYDPDTGRNELRRIVSIGGIPRGPGALDESVRIIVDLPAGTGNGPQVSDRLREWGVRSAPAYRLLINLAFHWYNPGVTAIPSKRGKTTHWVQVNDPERYPQLTDKALTSLAFPSALVSNRRVLTQRAKDVLRHLERAGELRILDSKVLPPLKSTDRN